MRYPYTRLSSSVPLRPYLQVTLRNGYSTTPVLYGLIDSGADYSIFPLSLSKDYLKLDLSTANTWTFEGTTGKKQVAYLAIVEVNLLSPMTLKVDYQFSAKIGFCDDFKFGGGALLGQDGFMSQF